MKLKLLLTSLSCLIISSNSNAQCNPVFVKDTGNILGITIPASLKNSFPCFGDIDYDGDEDLFVGQSNGNIIYYQNIGTTTSSQFKLQESSNNPFDTIDVGLNSTVSLVDIDNDGDLDAFIGEAEGNINYYKNLGNQAMAQFVLQLGNDNPFDSIDVGASSNITFIDVDNDGDMDAFIGNDGGNIKYFTNTGTKNNAQFLKQTGISNPLDSVNVGNYSNLDFVDIDSDGDYDVFLGEYEGKIYYYNNIGTISAPQFDFQSNTENPIIFIDIGNYSVPAFSDIDNDGDADAFIGEENGNISYYKNIGTVSSPQFIYQSNSKNPLEGITVTDFSSPSFMDADNDGDMDVFIGAYDGYIYFFKNIGSISTPQFVLQTGINNPLNGIDVGELSTPTFSDLDNDGDKDAIIGEWEGNINFLKNTGTLINPQFSLQQGSNNPLDSVDIGYASQIALVDIDNDGDQDVFIGETYGSISFYKNIGTAANPQFVEQNGSNNPLDTIDIGDKSSPFFVDIDYDGDMDVFIGESWLNLDGFINYFENIGTASSPQFANKKQYQNPLDGAWGNGNAKPIFEDLDKDGDMDCFIGNNGEILFYENIGSPTIPIFNFKSESLNPLINIYNSSGRATPSFIDIDNDGDQDAFVAGNSENILYYKNIGTSQEPIYYLQSGSINPLDTIQGISAVFVDMDNDYDFDAFLGRNNGSINYFKNIGSPSNPLFSLQQGNDNPLDSIDVGACSKPTFADIDGDKDYDAFIGNSDGLIHFFKNAGTLNVPSFVPQVNLDNPLDSVDVSYSSPTLVDYDNDGDIDAFIGSIYIYYYENIGTKYDPQFVLQASIKNPFDSLRIGQAWVNLTFTDIDKDGDQDAFIGDYGGNIHFFINECNGLVTNIISEPLGINSSYLLAYPNPTQTFLNIELGDKKQMQEIKLYNFLGQEVYRTFSGLSKACINVEFLKNGIYLLEVQAANEKSTKKIVVDR